MQAAIALTDSGIHNVGFGHLFLKRFAVFGLVNDSVDEALTGPGH